MVKVKLERAKLSQRSRRIRKRAVTDPDLSTMFEDEGDPLGGVEYDANDLEGSADREMSEIVRQIKADKKSRFERYRVARDPEYFLVLCFQSREQRDEFVKSAGWEVAGHGSDRYFDGLIVSELLGVNIAPIPLEPLPWRGKPDRFSDEEVL